MSGIRSGPYQAQEGGGATPRGAISKLPPRDQPSPRATAAETDGNAAHANPVRNTKVEGSVDSTGQHRSAIAKGTGDGGEATMTRRTAYEGTARAGVAFS